MPAYVVGITHSVSDPAGFEEYRTRLVDNVTRHNGRLVTVASGDQLERLDGEQEAITIVMLEFEDVESAKAWYEAEDYEPLKHLRQRSAQVEILLVNASERGGGRELPG